MEVNANASVSPSGALPSQPARTSPYAWKALAGSALGYAMDGFDLLILGFMLSSISADLHLSATQAGSLVTWTLIGAVAGGIIFGALSDRYGRIRVLAEIAREFRRVTGRRAVAPLFRPTAAALRRRNPNLPQARINRKALRSPKKTTRRLIPAKIPPDRSRLS